MTLGTSQASVRFGNGSRSWPECPSRDPRTHVVSLRGASFRRWGNRGDVLSEGPGWDSGSGRAQGLCADPPSRVGPGEPSPGARRSSERPGPTGLYPSKGQPWGGAGRRWRSCFTARRHPAALAGRKPSAPSAPVVILALVPEAAGIPQLPVLSPAWPSSLGGSAHQPRAGVSLGLGSVRAQPPGVSLLLLFLWGDLT